MSPRLEDGWLVAPCDAHDLAQVHIAVGAKQPGRWHPAYRDWDTAGTRVAKIRPPADAAGPVRVWLDVNGQITPLRGTVTL